MKRTRTSKAWMQEHVNDPFVQRAKAEGYRSRASFKLMEIDDRDHLIRTNDVVVDLGATPGGWSQVVARRMNGKGRIIALDLLEMEPLHGVDFIQGDFREESVLNQLEILLNGPGLFFRIWPPIYRVYRFPIRLGSCTWRSWVWSFREIG